MAEAEDVAVHQTILLNADQYHHLNVVAVEDVLEPAVEHEEEDAEEAVE